VRVGSPVDAMCYLHLHGHSAPTELLPGPVE
jgi:hypothetical protein